MAINFLQNQISHNLEIKMLKIILDGRLYSPSLKDVAWLEDAQLIFIIFLTFVCKIWLGRRTSRRGSGEKNYRQIQMYCKLPADARLSKLRPVFILNRSFFLSIQFNRRIVNRRLNHFLRAPFYPRLFIPKKKFIREITGNLGLF